MTSAKSLRSRVKGNFQARFCRRVRGGDSPFDSSDLDCEGRLVRVKVKPKMFKKLEDAQANYPMWVAAIAGKMGESIEGGFMLDQPNIQVFERKPKEPKPEVIASQFSEISQNFFPKFWRNFYMDANRDKAFL